jgi:hypothetical protein
MLINGSEGCQSRHSRVLPHTAAVDPKRPFEEVRVRTTGGL